MEIRPPEIRTVHIRSDPLFLDGPDEAIIPEMHLGRRHDQAVGPVAAGRVPFPQSRKQGQGKRPEYGQHPPIGESA